MGQQFAWLHFVNRRTDRLLRERSRQDFSDNGDALGPGFHFSGISLSIAPRAAPARRCSLVSSGHARSNTIKIPLLRTFLPPSTLFPSRKIDPSRKTNVALVLPHWKNNKIKEKMEKSLSENRRHFERF